MRRIAVAWSVIAAAATVGGGPVQAANDAWVNLLQDGGNLQALALDPHTPGTIYAAGWGVFKSTDGGTNWSAINSGLPPGHISALAIDPRSPGVLYAGHSGQGVFKSTDGGAYWSRTGRLQAQVRRLLVNSLNPDILYALTQPRGLFRSLDAGWTWTEVQVPIQLWALGCCSSPIYSVAVDPQNAGTVYAATAYFFDGRGELFKSTDYGKTWANLSEGLQHAEVYTIAIDPTDSEQVYAGVVGGILKSIDGGASWSNLGLGGAGAYVVPLAFDHQFPELSVSGQQHPFPFLREREREAVRN